MLVGDPVHYVLPEGPRAGECRPGVIVRVLDYGTSTAVLRVFTDGLSDSPRFHEADARLTAREDALGKPGSWHAKDGCRPLRRAG